MKMKLFMLAFCCFAAIGLVGAQDVKTEYVDVVYMKDGSLLIGKLINYETDKSILFELGSGNQVTLAYKDVRKVVQYVDPLTLKTKIKRSPMSFDYQFKEHGWNHQVLASTLWGRGEWNSLKVGIASEYVFGYRFNKALGLGLGTGINNYDLRVPQIIVPLYLEQRGYFSSNWVAPTYSIGGGYGFALNNSNTGFDEAQGGPLFNASVGLRLGAMKGINFLADIGIRYQRATYTDNWNWEPASFSEYRYDYVRWNLRIGATF